MDQPPLKWKLLIRNANVSPATESESEHDTREEALQQACSLPRHHSALRIVGPHGELMTAAEIRQWCSEHRGDWR